MCGRHVDLGERNISNTLGKKEDEEIPKKERDSLWTGATISRNGSPFFVGPFFFFFFIFTCVCVQLGLSPIFFKFPYFGSVGEGAVEREKGNCWCFSFG